ncbi:MAG TPA: DUF6265 family protein [Chitinophaga sp.]|uniref:DUF6265 family protein n=1 Tax=Chitinophaga sp. TaxID=1869181 RepID=UPI002C4089C3|nr:DUF6265 family protein [Chitinophaga sp.]HVI49430.1 DUF6265 family protein [Chitinophaga sp.]
MAKKLWYSSSILLPALLVIAGHAAAQASVSDFPLLNKLSGTWEMKTRRGAVVETWERINDSTLHARTWRVTGGDSSLQQTITLVRSGNEMFFIPSYTGKQTLAPIRLKLRVLKQIGFVAEDLNNDFPQKIIYRFKDDRHLEARVVGKRDGTTEEYIFRYDLAD